MGSLGLSPEDAYYVLELSNHIDLHVKDTLQLMHMYNTIMYAAGKWSYVMYYGYGIVSITKVIDPDR